MQPAFVSETRRSSALTCSSDETENRKPTYVQLEDYSIREQITHPAPVKGELRF